MLSPFGRISSCHTPIMLLRGANIPVEFVVKYAVPTPVDDSKSRDSLAYAVAVSLPSSVVM